jgi:hypothetical protein
LQLCTFDKLPIDFYFLESAITCPKKGTIVCPTGFGALALLELPSLKIKRTHWTYRHVILKRVGILDKTFFLRNDNLYSSYTACPDLALVGMIDLPAFKPDMCSRRFYSEQKLHTDIVAWDHSPETCSNGGMDMVEEDVVDGEYSFLESRTMSVSLSGHRKYARTLFIQLTVDGKWYACLGNLKPFKSQFLVNRPFRFFVIDGKLCLSKHVMCTGKPMSLMSLQQNRIFSVQQTVQKVMYGKMKRLVQFSEWPTIPFIASDELCAMLAIYIFVQWGTHIQMETSL